MDLTRVDVLVVRFLLHPTLKHTNKMIDSEFCFSDVGSFITRQDKSLVNTSRITSEDELSHFIINKDEQRIGEGTEPPVKSGKEKKNQ